MNEPSVEQERRVAAVVEGTVRDRLRVVLGHDMDGHLDLAERAVRDVVAVQVGEQRTVHEGAAVDQTVPNVGQNIPVLEVVIINQESLGIPVIGPELGVAPHAVDLVSDHLSVIHLDQQIKIPLHRVSREEFEEKRFEYHKEMTEDFFASYRVEKVEVYSIKRGDNIWTLSRDEFDVPLWLIRRFNTDIDFNTLMPTQKLKIPIIQKLT